MCTNPTWNSTFGPMQKKQSMMRNAKTMGMLLMNLERTADQSQRIDGPVELRRYPQAQEPWERCYGQLDIYGHKVVVDDWKTSVHQRLKHPLVKECSVH